MMFVAAADQRILRGVPATLTWQALDADGNEADPGTTTVRVVADDGTEVVPAGAATAGTGADPRSYTLDAAHNTRLDQLTVTWSSAAAGTQTTTVDVVGGFYFSVTEARASDATLTNDTKYPDEAVIAARREVEDEFERITGVAFVPRYGRSLVAVFNGFALLPPALRVVRSATPYGCPTYTSDQLAALQITDYGAVTRLGNTVTSPLDIAYEHGMSRCPPDIKRAALIRLRSRLNLSNSGISERAKTYTPDTGIGTIELSEPDGLTTGIPEVDAVLQRPGLNFRTAVF